MGWRVVAFLAVMLTALALVPGGAHLAEMPNKMALGEREYFIVQDIYRGWAWFGIALCGALAANLALALLLRRDGLAGALALAAAALVSASLVVFFVWTFPANQATANWTRVPASWQEMRRQWESSHAAGAALNLLALGAVTAASLLAERRR
jgi:hypothetical protein